MVIKEKETPVKRRKLAKKKTDSREVAYTLIVVLAVIVIGGLYFYLTKSDGAVQKNRLSPGGTISTTQAGEGIPGKPESGLPEITGAKLQLETANDVDVLRVIPEGTTKTGGPPTFIYQWIKNGQPVEGNNDSISGFKRGDNIAVKITPFDGVNYGEPKVITTQIENTPPVIVEHKEIGFDGTTLTYQVKAIDKDGDRITYSLVDPPPGMTIGPATGTITWKVKPEQAGTYNVQVKAVDGYGGEGIYTITITISPPPS